MRAVAAALQTEYRYIVDRGLLLQIDAPDLALERHTLFADRPLDEFLDWVELVIERINDALDGIDPSAVRLHVCWGNYEGPHTLDVAAERDPVPCSTRRTSARWWSRWPTPATPTSTRCFAREPLPDGMVLVAGVIDTTSNYVEHPEVVADRLVRIARRRRRPAPDHRRHRLRLRHLRRHRRRRPSVVWEKLRALRAGADLASSRLF